MGLTFDRIDFDPFASIANSAPSTEAQREIFTSVKLGGYGANCAYNESVSLYLSGPLDVINLQKAIELLTARYDSLRAKFNKEGTDIYISPTTVIPFFITDLPCETEEDKKQFIKDIEKKEVQEAFNLEKGPLLRVRLINVKNNEHVLIVTGHHIICDGWSLSLLLQDLSKIYSALVKNEELSLSPAVSFIEYAKMQEKYQQSISNSATEIYWMKQFQGEIPVVEFPTDKKRPAQRTFNAKRIDVPVPSETVNALRSLSKKTGTSFVTLMLSVFESFLYRITDQQELVVGLPAAGQNAEGLYNLVGHCVNLLPLRTSVDPHQTFLSYLQKRKKYLFDAFDNQKFTFGSLIRKLNITRDASRIPLVPVIMNVDIGFTEGFHFEGLTFNFKSNPRVYENFEVFINASGSNDNLLLETTFNADLFEEKMMQHRMQELISFMSDLVKNPETTIAAINLLTKEDQSVFSKINHTQKIYSQNKGIHQLFEDKVKQQPDAIAVSCSSNLYTYQEADNASSNIAQQLQQRGIKPGNIVGVCLPRTAELPVVLLGILKCGATYLPLDPAFPDDRLKMMLEDSNAAIVITNKQYADELELTDDKKLLLNEKDFKSVATFHSVTPENNQLAYLLYTSGSTGKPKGVLVTHRSVINLLVDLKDKISITSVDVLLAITTISFDISVLEIFLPLISGARVHIATREQSLDASWLEKTIVETPVTFMQATPATWELLLASGWRGNNALTILCGGEALRVELAERLLKRNAALWNLYGPTETTIWSTIKKINAEDFTHARNGIISIGKPVANTQIYVVDNDGNPSPLGVAGELLIGGDGVSRGYLNRDELNAEKFIKNPFGSDRVYKTGDRVIIDHNGDLYFINRSDHQLKIRGYRIEPGEVETALHKVEGIKQAVVIARKGVGGDMYLAAYFLMTSNVDGLPKSELQELLMQRAKKTLAQTLPDYMIPTSWMLLDEFPLTPNAKVDRKALPDPHSVANTMKHHGDTTSFTPTEKIIADVWRNILSLTVVGSDDDFFELGGHSLLAVRMMVELENKTGIKLPLAVLFSHPTVRELSSMYEAPPQEKLWSPLVTIKKSGNRNPIFFAHGISGNVFKYHLLAQLIDPDQPSYGLQAVGLNGIDQPIRNLREMATYHMKEILKFQPVGPYALAGGSFGGYLAYEIACQLQNAGHEVSFLCLFDAEAASELDFLPTGVKQLKAAQLLTERFVKRAVDFIQADSEKRSHYLQAKLKSNNAGNDLESWLDKHKMVELIGEESASYFRKVEEACYDALVTYKIGKFNGEILLIRARDGYFNNTFAEDLGWSHFVNGNINIQLVPGDHNSIFWEPAVHDLTKVMVTALADKTIPKKRK